MEHNLEKRKLISNVEKVLEYENQMIEDLKGLLSIESIRDDSKATADAPVGPGPREALDYMYNLGKRDGFQRMTLII